MHAKTRPPERINPAYCQPPQMVGCIRLLGGVDPREGAGEPFCYMLSQLLLEANVKVSDAPDKRRSESEIKL